MKLKEFEIYGYRKFKNETKFILEDTLTICAGANNSGKTSALELLHAISEKNLEFKFSDINLENLEETFDVISNEKENILEKLKSIEIKINLKINFDDNFSNAIEYITDLEDENYIYISIYTSFKKKIESKIKEIEEFDTAFFENIISENMDTTYSICDRNFAEKKQVKKSIVSKLFNVRKISAQRKADDENINKNYFKTDIVKSISNNKDTWDTIVTKSVTELKKTLYDESGDGSIHKVIKTMIEDKINNPVSIFHDISGSQSKVLKSNITLNKEILEKILPDMILLQYFIDEEKNFGLSESSQGLGFNNLLSIISMLELNLQEMLNPENSEKIHLVIIEEPEAHFHPQMERALINFILDKTAITTPTQIVISTHSTEIIKSVQMENIRVFRTIDSAIKIFNLSDYFSNGLDAKDIKFMKKFFPHNFAEVVFADSAILFEGDTERLYLKNIISKHETLKNSFIMYFQVGGAYANKYFDFLKFLEMKTLILTDIDYDKGADRIDKIKKTTNKIIKDHIDKSEVNIVDFMLQPNFQPDDNVNYIKVFTQGKMDGYSRTFEDAILFNNLNTNDVFTNVSKDEFEVFLSSNNIEGLSKRNQNTTIRKRIEKIISKTDFIFSVINSDIDLITPHYIEEGLKWLAEK